jgi:hypothetical protein
LTRIAFLAKLADHTMGLIVTALRVAALALIAGASGDALAQETPAFQALAAYEPEVRWDASSELSADINCDGRPDQALLGRREGKVYVGLVVSGRARPEILGFGIGGAVQDTICAEPAVLRVESLDYDPKKAGGRLDGFRRSKRCKGLRLSGGQCDSIHFFWNHRTKELDWWRL